MIKIVPLGELSYQLKPLADSEGKQLKGIIEVAESDVQKIGRSLKFNDTRTALVPIDIVARRKELNELRLKRIRIAGLKRILEAYTQDFAQAMAGVYIPDIEERKAKFRAAHAELRQLEGKPTRG